MAKKSDAPSYGRTQFEFLIVIMFIFIIFSIATASLVWGGVGSSPSVTGSGYIEETVSSVSGNKIVEVQVAKVSFSGKFYFDSNNLPDGSGHIKFFDIAGTELDNTNFRITKVTSLALSNNACGASARVVADGVFNNQYGWYVILDMADQGADSSTFRVQLYYPPSGLVYDSASQFTNSSFCPPQTLVDSGRLTINTA
jgi:hypothetical protein